MRSTREIGFGAMVKPSTRRLVADMSHHEESQEAFSGARANQTSVYVSREEMETMVNAMQERMLKRQEEVM